MAEVKEAGGYMSTRISSDPWGEEPCSLKEPGESVLEKRFH